MHQNKEERIIIGERGIIYQYLNLGLTATPGEANEPSAWPVDTLGTIPANPIAQVDRPQIKLEARMIPKGMVKVVSQLHHLRRTLHISFKLKIRSDISIADIICTLPSLRDDEHVGVITCEMHSIQYKPNYQDVWMKRSTRILILM